MEHIIDLSAIADAKAFHQALAKELALPEWYGHNLDALYDCLTELEAPLHLILQHWDRAAAFADGFESVFEDAQAEDPDFTVEYR